MLGLFSRGTGFGIEVGQGALRAASVGAGRGTRAILQIDSANLPSGTLEDSFTKPNILDRSAFIDTARKLAGRMGRRGRRVNVALPDTVARVVLVDFEILPKKADEIEKMIRWKLKKLLPFDVEQAVLRYQYLGALRDREAETHKYVAAVIKSEILGQYESAINEAGLRPGRIDIASFCVWNLYHDVLAAEAGGKSCCLLNLSCGKITVMVFEGGAIRFFRLKDMALEGQACATGEMVLRELRASLTYYKEHVSGGQVGLVYVAGQTGDPDRMVDEIGSGTGFEARVLRVDKVLGDGGMLRRTEDMVLFGAACGAALER